MGSEKYFIGLDIGTDSVGYAVSEESENYPLIKKGSAPIWGVSLFEEAKLRDERRSFRTARRRLDRRQQRIRLLQELFASEIGKIDKNFYRRIAESALLRADAQEPYSVFCDPSYSDAAYHREYPTIHHLICELIDNKEPHDVRLVYLACAWLLAHRGHFLSEISEDNLSSATDFSIPYHNLMEYFSSVSEGDEYTAPWKEPDLEELEKAIKEKTSVTAKYKKLIHILLQGKKPSKKAESSDAFPFSVDGILRLISGGTVAIKDLFGNDEYAELGSFSLNKPDEEFENLRSAIGDDMMLLDRLKEIFDWATLCDMLKGKKYISEAKKSIYEQHKEDLAFLKKLIKKYIPDRYNEVFREENGKPNYVAYSGNEKSVSEKQSKFKKKKEDFSKYILSLVKDLSVDASDKEQYDDMLRRLDKDVLAFLPKQVDGDNRVIPYQLYYAELKQILQNASAYLPFLSDRDEDGYSVSEKILSIMRFRVPYFVGPLNSKEFGWMKRKADGKIYPWNFEDKVDLEARVQEFINRMPNTCTYLPDKAVLPKHSLLYEKFEVLNEINNIKVMGTKIPVSVKQGIFNDLFLKKKKVTPKMIRDYLVSNGYCSKEDAATVSGIDETIKSSLSSHVAFARLMESSVLSESDVEKIIRHRTYIESKSRFAKWLGDHYDNLKEEDRRYICSLSLKDFGRLSGEFLNGLEGTCRETGEVGTILHFLWTTHYNISELVLSDENFTFKGKIEEYTHQYYVEAPKDLDDRLNEMYVSNAVKRPIIRTLDIVHDVVKVMGNPPQKIFVEMARGGKEEQKGKRTKSRKQQILDLYREVKDVDVKELSAELEKMGDEADNRLQSESLFLYFMQLGKCMYSGEHIDINRLKDGTYNIDHIYPQSYVKDDSVLNNKVLVLSTYNDQKKNIFPVPSEWRTKMHAFWKLLLGNGLINEEKYKRLTRATTFTDDEKYGFINRQLVETRQSTKVITTLLKEKYPTAEIVYVKAGLVSDFRHEYDMLKSRSVNDLHHAKDAYLNIVCGNVYHEKFTKEWFLKHKDSEDYTINQKVLFGKTQFGRNGCLWNGEKSLAAIKKTMSSNQIHMTQYAFCRQGGFFKRNPLRAAEGLVPRKAGLPTEKYGGYNEPTVTYFALAKYRIGQKSDVMIVSVDLLNEKRFSADERSAVEYLKERIEHILGKTVDEVTLPLGCRKLKINTVFSLDGFRICLSSTDSGGTGVGLKPIMPLILSYEWEKYVKRLESYCGKAAKNDHYVFSEKYDLVTKEKNIELYRMLQKKLEERPYCLRPEKPLERVKNAASKFEAVNIQEQCNCLLNMISYFGRSAVKDSLTGAGGNCRMNSKLSNWKKYSDVRIIDSSASGLWEKKSCNLLDLL